MYTAKCLLEPRRPYRTSKTASAFFNTVWSPQEKVLKVGGIDDEFLEFVLDDTLDNKSVFDANHLFDKANKFAAEIEWNPDVEAFNHAVRVAKGVFAPRHYISRLESPEQVRPHLKIDKSSGAPVFIKKGDAFHEDWERSLAIGRGDRAPPPCVALRRTQHGESGPKTRLVWGYPQAMTMLEAKYAAPLIEALSGHPCLPYRMRKVELQAWLTRIENRPFRLGLDYSGFDASVSRTFIRVAFDILREWFIDVDDSEWSRIVSYFIFTDIIMPDRVIYRKKHGIPSGSYFTQLVGSIVNFIALQYAMKVLGVELSHKNVMVMGDDSIAAPSRGCSIGQISSVLGNVGLSVNTDKSYVSYRDRPGDGVHFLGHTWDHGYPSRSFRDILIRLVYVERWTSVDQKPEERFAAFMADAVGTWKLYCRWTYKSVHGCILTKLPYVRCIQYVEEVGMSKGLHPGGLREEVTVGATLSIKGLLL